MISVNEATINVPKRAAIIVGISAPPFLSANPPIISGATKFDWHLLIPLMLVFMITSLETIGDITATSD